MLLFILAVYWSLEFGNVGVLSYMSDSESLRADSVSTTKACSSRPVGDAISSIIYFIGGIFELLLDFYI